jgi:TIR domain-containing protein
MPSMVFISHSSKDRATADAICAHVESAGIKCWIAPRDIEPGATWTKGIMRGLETCRVLILVFSEHANDSDHVQREVAKAFSSGLAVIPFRIKDVLPNQSLSYFLDTVQWLDASAPPLQKHLGTLSEQVKKLLVDETTRQPPKRLGPAKISRRSVRSRRARLDDRDRSYSPIFPIASRSFDSSRRSITRGTTPS